MDGVVMYKFCDQNGENISTHDCYTTNILYENGILTFVFADGIWLTKDNPNNTTGKTIRTDRAEVQFALEFGTEDDISIYVFKNYLKKTIRKEWKLSKLIEYANSGKKSLEFLYQYQGYHSVIIECMLWSDKKSYHQECELKISLKDMKYCWNKLYEEREW